MKFTKCKHISSKFNTNRKLVVILGADHLCPIKKIGVSQYSWYETPFGNLKADDECEGL